MNAEDLRSELLNVLYPLPREVDSLEEHERHRHRDLARRPRPDLARERERIRLRLLIEDDPDSWLLERLSKLRGVLDRAR